MNADNRKWLSTHRATPWKMYLSENLLNVPCEFVAEQP